MGLELQVRCTECACVRARVPARVRFAHPFCNPCAGGLTQKEFEAELKSFDQNIQKYFSEMGDELDRVYSETFDLMKQHHLDIVERLDGISKRLDKKLDDMEARILDAIQAQADNHEKARKANQHFHLYWRLSLLGASTKFTLDKKNKVENGFGKFEISKN